MNTPAQELFSNSRINNNQDEIVEEDKISEEGAARRINSVCARATSTMIPSSVKELQFSQEYNLDDQNMSIKSVRSVTFEQWCKHKEIMQRLKDKLVQDEKLKIFEQNQMKSDI